MIESRVCRRCGGPGSRACHICLGAGVVALWADGRVHPPAEAHGSVTLVSPGVRCPGCAGTAIEACSGCEATGERQSGAMPGSIHPDAGSRPWPEAPPEG